jgi:hypothetical protein
MIARIACCGSITGRSAAAVGRSGVGASPLCMGLTCTAALAGALPGIGSRIFPGSARNAFISCEDSRDSAIPCAISLVCNTSGISGIMARRTHAPEV